MKHFPAFAYFVMAMLCIVLAVEQGSYIEGLLAWFITVLACYELRITVKQ